MAVSGSVVEKVPTLDPLVLFSAMANAERESAVGASFTSVTVMVKTCSNDKPPWSVVRTRTE